MPRNGTSHYPFDLKSSARIGLHLKRIVTCSRPLDQPSTARNIPTPRPDPSRALSDQGRWSFFPTATRECPSPPAEGELAAVTVNNPPRIPTIEFVPASEFEGINRHGDERSKTGSVAGEGKYQPPHDMNLRRRNPVVVAFSR
jgi:hypothetical protein